MTADLVANLSTIYGRLPQNARAAAARADGYLKVESWWDFDSAEPPRDELDSFVGSIESAGVQLVALNSHGGDRHGGERGLASLPGRREEFRLSIAGISGVAARLGVRMFNVAAGNRVSGLALEEQLAVAKENYRYASAAVEPFGGLILIEALSARDNPGYLFSTGYDVAQFLREMLPDRQNIGLLFDTYHLASNGLDVVDAFRELAPHVRHLQLADAPGRGKPGTGDIDFPRFLAEVAASGYDGETSLEYLPSAA